MDNLQIDSIALANPCTNKIYEACIPCNQLPLRRFKKSELPRFFIINLCDSSRSDETCHWVSLFLNSNRIEFFDSAGVDSFRTNKYIYRFVKRQKQREIIFNQRQIQSYSSNYCGLFCLVFLYAKAINLRLSHFVKVFKPDLVSNDEIVKKLFTCAFLKHQNDNKNCKTCLKKK